MNLFAAFSARLAVILERLPQTMTLPAEVRARAGVEPPRDASHGDLSTNAAMVLAKDAGVKPRELAEAIAAALAEESDVAEVGIAGAGFINVRLKPEAFETVVRAALAGGEGFGRSTMGAGLPINVEFVSANPTGPMHIGHCRGAAYGDALANLLAFAGHPVTREYYINDAGSQVDVLARSAFHRYREALGEPVGPVGEGLYPGDYLKPIGAALAAEYGPALKGLAEAEWLPLVRARAVDAMMTMVRADLAELGVHHDVFFSERSLTEPDDRIAAVIEDLRARGLVYEGVLPPPKGERNPDWEDRAQTLFRATAFGDDVDRPLKKSDGSYAYFAPDIAYHKIKFDRGAPVLIDVLGADHGGYIKRLTAAVTAVTEGRGLVEVRVCQLVKLMRAGEPVKMSKRSGDFVTLREVLDEVGRDPIRFMMLYRKNDAELEFDLAKVIEQSKDNPVFYVQYAHARCASLVRQAEAAFPDVDFSASALREADIARLVDPSERDVMRKIAAFPRLIEAAAAQREPHRLAFYLEELASSFHALWNRGKDLPALRFVNSDDRQRSCAALALVRAVMSVLHCGLALLGVSAPLEMRG